MKQTKTLVLAVMCLTLLSLQFAVADETSKPIGGKAPAVRLVFPEGGERFVKGDAVDVKWSEHNIAPNRYEIMLSEDGGKSYPHELVVLRPEQAKEHSWTWNVEDHIGTMLRLKVVVHYGELIAEAACEKDFTVLAEPDVAEKPDVRKAGDKPQISRQENLKPGTKAEIASAPNQKEGAGSEVKSAPSLKEGMTADAQKAETPMGVDKKVGIDGAVAPPKLAVLSPNGGEAIAVGSTTRITWAEDPKAEFYNILVNRAPQKNWEVIAENVKKGTTSFAWSVSGEASNECWIKVEAKSVLDMVSEDTSDKAFRITPKGNSTAK